MIGRVFVTLKAAAMPLVLIAGFGCDADARIRKPALRVTVAPAVSRDIIWGEQITLTPPDGGMGRYPRLVQIKTAAHQGDLLLFYQTERTGGDFWMYRSNDGGHHWGNPVKVNAASAAWNFASCNVIQLQDGRLMMTMQRRARNSNLGQDFYMDVRFSSDGGDRWTARQQVFQGANWEGRAIQVPHDANGDGIADIYLFFTQHVIPTTLPVAEASRVGDHGRAVAWIASYDGGKSWGDPNAERFTGRIVHRNFLEGPGQTPTDQSGGGMPTPFLLPDNRVGFVAEEIEKKPSPLLIANDPGDWDWTGAAFQGPWSSADYDGSQDDRIYPAAPENRWRIDTLEFGGAPYGTVLPDGRIAVSTNSAKRIKVWVGDANGHDFHLQDLPFGTAKTLYSFIEPIGPHEVLVGAGPADSGDSFIYLRRGTLQ